MTTVNPSKPKHPITWDTPKEWREEPAKGMRYGSFVAAQRAANDQTTNISVVFLPSPTGSDLTNINRWRQRLSLGRWTETEMNASSQILTTPIGQARVVNLMGAEEAAHLKITAAIVPVDEGAWFIKMTADQKLADEQSAHFARFLQSLKFIDQLQR